MNSLPGPQLRRVTDFIDENLAHALPLAALSAEASLSQFHFARLFKRSMGVSPHRFVVQRRIERACALLIDRTLSIDAIARAVGFRTRSHFSVMFHRLTGTPPTVYRAFASVPTHPRDAHAHVDDHPTHEPMSEGGADANGTAVAV
jgi:AraC family transcriptional regulator